MRSNHRKISKFFDRPPKILIVDDEADMRQAIIEDISSQTERLYDPIEASDGEMAIKIVKNHQRLLGMLPNEIKAIITDIKMPKMNGLEFLEALENLNRYTQKIPILFLSSYQDLGKWQAAKRHRLSDYIIKPYEKSDLLEKLDKVVYSIEGSAMRYFFQKAANQKIKEYKEPGS